MGIRADIQSAATVAELRVLYQENVVGLEVLQAGILAKRAQLKALRQDIKNDEGMVENYERIATIREACYKRLGELTKDVLTS